MSREELARFDPAPFRARMDADGRTAEDIAQAANTTIEAVRKVIYDACRFTETQAVRLADAIGVAPSSIWADWNDVTGTRIFERPTWMHAAACRGEDSDLFFVPHGERPEARDIREWRALEFCERCDVVDACRDYARRGREYGVWGGETELDRINAGYAPPMLVRTNVHAPGSSDKE